ncbi:hypothetical protein OC861_004163 [Tilletia horrida]|nr:hypothetical protein OC861_004163 [Tilletia horrida]
MRGSLFPNRFANSGAASSQIPSKPFDAPPDSSHDRIRVASHRLLKAASPSSPPTATAGSR